MRKRWAFFIMALMASLTVGMYFFTLRPPKNTDYCAFCDPIVAARQTFYEDDLVLVWYTHKPILPGHCLVLPKRHVERFELLTDEEIAQMGRVIKRVNQAVMKTFGTSSYLLLQKNGMEVGQSVPHVHIHYIPKKEESRSIIGFLIKLYIANIKDPIAANEMHEIVAQLNQAVRAESVQSQHDHI